jgi:hypothetical protein
MSDIQQLVYASRASFKPAANGGGVEPEVARILAQSRHNNPRRQLVGALYYGDGCFFQCLEGPQDAIDALYEQLMVDSRHSDLKVLLRKSIGATSFAGWSMKYVPAATDVQNLLATRGLSKFDPYAFDNALLDAMVGLLHRRAGEASAAPVSASPGPVAPAAAARKAGAAAKLGWAALGVAVLVLLVVLFR